MSKRCFCILPLDIVGAGPNAYAINPALQKQAPNLFFFNRDDAIESAKSYAQLHPKTQVLVLGAIDMIEAKRPETTHKEFKENGELIPAREET